MRDVAGRLATRVRPTTDGHKPYLAAVEGAFGADVDHAVPVKLYGQGREGQARPSASAPVGRIEGRLDPAHVSTSHAER